MTAIVGVGLAAVACFGGGLIYPGAVDIREFSTDRAVYRPGDMAEFRLAILPSAFPKGSNTPNLIAQIWVERELESPFLAASCPLSVTNGQCLNVLMKWKCDKDVFGHRAWIRCVDPHGRLLAESDVLFDVASDWIHVMRLACAGANVLADGAVSTQRIRATVSKCRRAHINAVEMYAFSPQPYKLAPDEDQWPYEYGTGVVKKDRIVAWGRELHKNGLKYIAYNETCAADGPEEAQFWLRGAAKGEPLRTYFAEKGFFVPNALIIGHKFAQGIEQSVKMFDWDAILMDSALQCYIATSGGVSQGGIGLTDLPAGDVGYQYLAEAYQLLRQRNPDFRFLSQNASTISSSAVKSKPEAMRALINENAKGLNLRRYSELTDCYTVEIDSHNEPRDGRYPLTYEAMSWTLNSIIEATGRPLMAWASLTSPFPGEYSIASLRPYMALHLASRTHVHDHYIFYGGALSDGENSPVARQFTLYSRFEARFSYYMFDPQLRWLGDARRCVQVKSPSPLMWENLVYERGLAGGGRRIVINLLNLPQNGKVLDQKDIPQVAQNVEVSFRGNLRPTRVVCLDADDPSLTPMPLLKAAGVEGPTTYNVPPIVCWKMLVIE
jgi:hypothetical protein